MLHIYKYVTFNNAFADRIITVNNNSEVATVIDPHGAFRVILHT